MWTREKGHVPDSGPTPPEERGQRLASIPRGRDEELRISLDEYEGRPYVSVRVWARGTGGSWWPVKAKGLSIRLREIDDVIEALAQAADMTDDPAPAPRPSAPARQPSRPQAARQGSQRPPGSPEEF